MAAGRIANPFTSITKQMSQQGMGTPRDMISSILGDHESKISSTQSYVAPPSDLQPRMRSDTSTLKRTHWQPVDKVPKCATCRKRFGRWDRRRNCCMCGDVFCRRCTNFRRKLSTNAEPDPLGTFFHVCRRCFDKTIVLGWQRDLTEEFKRLRSAKQSHMKRHEEQEKKKPLSARQMSTSKQAALRKEADRLTEGFKANTGWVHSLMSEVKVPAWQRASKWVPSGQIVRGH